MRYLVAYDEYLKYCRNHLKLSSYLDRLTLFKQFITPVFGDCNIEDITKDNLKKWQTNLEKYSYKYKSKIRGALFNFLKFAEYEYNIPNQLKNVWNFTKDKYNAKTKFNIYSEKEYLRLFSVIDKLEDKCIFNILYLCQLRKGELCALTWNDFLKDRKYLDINKTFCRVNDYLSIDELSKYNDKVFSVYITGKVVYILQHPKSPNSIRRVALPKSTTELLTEYFNFKKSVKDFSKSDFIFGKNKTFLKYTTLSNRFEKYRKIAKLKKIRVHDLRHSGVSYLINTYSGNLTNNALHLSYIIAERIGDDVEQVLHTYGHLFSNEQINLISDIDI